MIGLRVFGFATVNYIGQFYLTVLGYINGLGPLVFGNLNAVTKDKNRSGMNLPFLAQYGVLTFNPWNF